MAKKTQTELLEGILLILDQTLGETKKKNKAVGDSNVPKGAGVVNAKDISVKAVGDALSVLSSAVPKLAKISEKQYDTVAKGVEKIATAISSFKMDKDTLAGVSNMVSAFVQIHNVISGMSQNFIKSILSLNPIKAWILGRRLGRFYGILAKGMVAGFVKQMVDIINQVPPNRYVQSKTFKARIVNFGLLMAALLQIKAKHIMQLWMMGVFLGPRIGKAIGGFFKELIDKLAGGRNGVEKAKAAANVAMSVAALVGTLSLCLIALVILWKSNDIKDLLGGFGLLTLVVAFALGIIYILGSNKFKKSAVEGLSGVKMVLLLIGGLTLTLLVVVAVGKKDIATIAKGLLLFAVIVGTAILLMRILASDKFKQQSVESLFGVGAILLLVLGLSVVALFTDKFAKDWKKRLFGMAILAVFVAASIGLLFLLSLVAKNKETMINALIGTAVIVLMIAGVSGAMLIFGEFLKKLNGITDKTIAWGIGLTVAMIVGMIGLAHLLSPLAIDPLFWAGFGMVETIAIMIASISGTMLLFSNLLKEIKNLSKEDIQDAVDKLIMKDGMVDALRSIIDALDDFGIKSAIKVAAIGKAIQPVISSISQFVDVIQKMASMKIADAWDKNGKPTHYMRLKPKSFKKAAVNLSKAFSVFVTELGKAFSKIDRKARKNMKKLSGPISEIIKGVAALIQPLMQIASGKMQVGNEVVSVDLNKILKASNGIVNIITSIFGPLNELAEKNIKHRKIKKLFKTFRKSMKQLIELFKYAAKVKIPIDDSILTKLDFLTRGGDIIIKFLNQNFEDAYTNAKIFKKALKPFRKSVKSLFGLFKYTMEIGIPIDDSYIQTITTLRTGLVKILALLQLTDYLKTAKKNSKTLIDVFSNFVKGYKTLFKTVKFEKMNKAFIEQTANLVEGLSNIVGFLTNLDSATLTTTKRGFFGRLKTQSVSKLIHNSKMFKEVMKNTAAGINHIKPFLSATPKQIVDLANAMKQLDAELIAKEEQRTKAIQSVASNFKDMAAGVNQLNTAMHESMRLTRLYSAMRAFTSGNIISKGVNAAVEGAEKMGNIVKDALTQNKHEEQKKIEEEQKKQDREELAAVIGNAVSAALTAWSESHKDLTVQFSDSPEKIFGEIRNG